MIAGACRRIFCTLFLVVVMTHVRSPPRWCLSSIEVNAYHKDTDVRLKSRIEWLDAIESQSCGHPMHPLEFVVSSVITTITVPLVSAMSAITVWFELSAKWKNLDQLSSTVTFWLQVYRDILWSEGASLLVVEQTSELYNALSRQCFFASGNETREKNLTEKWQLIR